MSIKKMQVLPWLICGLGALFYCYEYFLRISPSVMMPQLSQYFNVNAAVLGNMVAFYYYAYTPMQLPVGVLMDRYGPRRLLVIAALVCTLGSCMFAFGHIGVAEAGRFLVGFGSAFAFVGVLKLASLWLPPSYFAMIAGLVTSLGVLGGMFGDMLLARLVHNLGWHLTVCLSAGVGVILAASIWYMIPKNNADPSIKQLAPPVAPMTFSQLFAELLILVKKPTIWIVGIIGCLLYLPTAAFAELWGIPYLQQAYGLSSTSAADAVSMIFLGWAVGGPLVGWFSDKFKKRNMPIVAGALFGAFVITIVLYSPQFAHNKLFILFFLLGVCCSVENIVFAIARDNNHPSLVGTAMALTNMLIMMGGVLYQPLIGRVLVMLSGNATKGNMSIYTAHDFQFAFILLPVGLVLAAGLIFLVKEPGTAKQKQGKYTAVPVAITD